MRLDLLFLSSSLFLTVFVFHFLSPSSSKLFLSTPFPLLPFLFIFLLFMSFLSSLYAHFLFFLLPPPPPPCPLPFPISFCCLASYLFSSLLSSYFFYSHPLLTFLFLSLFFFYTSLPYLFLFFFLLRVFYFVLLIFYFLSFLRLAFYHPLITV